MSNAWGTLRDRWVLHFTHMDNLPAILASGSLVGDCLAREEHSFTEVGDPAIKANRRDRVVPIGPGGTVGDYVPFYFAPRSPMLYRIACDCRDSVPGRYQGGDRPLVYLAARIGAVVDAGLTWVGTNGNAAALVSEFTCDLGELEAMVDWPLMLAERWNNVPEDPDRQRRRMAEFLVHRQVPVTLVHQVATYSNQHAEQVAAVLAGHDLADALVVRPQWYYGYEPRR